MKPVMAKSRLRFDMTLSLPPNFGAIGGEVINGGTDDIIIDENEEMFCDQCIVKCNKKTVASVFCVMCQEYFCMHCERVHGELHNNEGIIRRRGMQACQITCCHQHFDGTIFVVDELNKKVKRLHNETNEVMNYCSFLDTPRRVCSLDQHEIAVTLDNHQVQFIVILGTVMVVKPKIKVKHACLAIASHGDELYITDNDTIYVHKKDGTFLRKLSKFGRNEIADIQNLCISRDGQRLYFTDYKEGFFTIDPQGKVISKYSGPGLDGACGLCPAGCSGVLACGYDSRTFIQFDADGKRKGEITCMGKYINQPVAICFDRPRMKLWVAQKKSDAVAVMDLTEAPQKT